MMSCFLKCIILLVCMATILTATGCGGGGGSTSTLATPVTPSPTPEPAPTPDPTPTPIPVAQPVIKGFWTGSQGTNGVSAIILANGDAWVVFLEAGSATSFARLHVTTSSSSFSSNGTRYLLQSGTTEAAAASGSFTEKTTLVGSMVTPNGSTSLSLAYDVRYATTATIADAVGTWKGSYRNNSSVLTMTVGSTGTLSGSSTTGCTYGGNLQPRSADPAVLDLSFTETCQGSSTAMTGIATVNAAKTGISFAVTTPDTSKGALFAGVK